MQAMEGIGTLRRPKGLAARAVLFTCVLLVVTGTLSALTVLVGAQRESARHQLNTTRSLAMHLARISGDIIAQNDMETLRLMVAQTSGRTEVRRVSIRDASGAIWAEAGGNATDAAVVERVARQVLETRRLSSVRSANHGLALGAPIMRDGEFVGVALMMWDGSAYRFQALTALAPFLLILACLGLIAVPLTAHIVRRTAAPLNQLARFAEKIAENGEAAPIEVKTGDEFETLATAFNKMMSRLDASMRQIQEIAFVDPVTRLPNQDRFTREIDFFILQARQEGAASGIGVVVLFELQRLPKLMQTLDADETRDLLRVVAQRLNAAVATVDRIVRLGQDDRRPVVARLGGMEFGVFVPGAPSPADAARFAQHLNAALN